MVENSKNAQDASAPIEPDLQISDTIEAAAGVTGYLTIFLQRLKARGCPAFRNGRVHIDELETYIAENEADCSALERQCEEELEVDTDVKRERRRKLKIQNDVAEGKLVSKEDIVRRIELLAGELKEVLRNALEDEMPRILAGRSETEIRAEGRQLVDRICSRFERGTKWTNPAQ